MDTLQRLAIELACTRLVNQFAVFNDSGRHEELAALFTEEGSYARPLDPDSFVHGPAAILAQFRARPQDKVFRHLITNILIDVTGETTARGFCYVTLYGGSTSQPADRLGYRVIPPQLVGEYHDDFVLTPDGWRFQRRQGKLIFTT